MKTVKCKFFTAETRAQAHRSLDSREYSYTFDGDVESGDIGLVHNGTEFCLVKVVSVTYGQDPKITKPLLFVASKKVMEEYEATMARVAERKNIFLQLERLQEQETLEQRFARLATTNPEAKVLIDRLKEIDG